MSEYEIWIEKSSENDGPCRMVSYVRGDYHEALSRARKFLEEDSATAVEIVEEVRIKKILTRLERGATD